MEWHINDAGVIVAEYGGHVGFFDHFWQAEQWQEAINSYYESKELSDNEKNEDQMEYHIISICGFILFTSVFALAITGGL